MILHNETVDAILNRRSIRSYQAEQISKNELETILEAGRYAPSGMNQQSARAVVIQSKSEMEKLVALAKTATHREQNPFYDAPTVILVFAKQSNLTPVEDGCTAIENMFLAAQSLSIGTCWIYAVTAMFASSEGKTWMQEHGVSEDFEIVGSLAVGYPAGEHPQPKERNSFYCIL